MCLLLDVKVSYLTMELKAIKRDRKKSRSYFLISVGCFFCVFLLISWRKDPLQRQNEDGQIFRSLDDVTSQSWDAILILGGGVPSSLYDPPAYVKRRCDDAAAIRRGNNHRDDTPILTLSAGTAHLPQLLSTQGLPVWESTSSAAYLRRQHNIESNVYLETTSYDTIGNAFYTRTIHTDVVGWRRLLIVTNQFHMDRTKVIFDWIFGVDQDSRHPYHLSYFESPNVGLSGEALDARQVHEMNSAKTIRSKLAPKYQTLKDVWTFINTNHDLYTASKLIDGTMKANDKTKNDALKKSYGA